MSTFCNILRREYINKTSSGICSCTVRRQAFRCFYRSSHDERC